MAILLYIGGGLVITFAMFGWGGSVGGLTNMLPVWGQLLYGAFYVVLARSLQLGLRWGRLTVVVLCWIGLGIAALAALAFSPAEAFQQAIWPVVYLILVSRPSVRDWFASKTAAAGEDVDGAP
ncbi:hypothetical protein [Actinoplanes flavus]|uniref:Uncharacterized protein n=1 Tax=Actinoplanes flavus TaxID=2820290 RepID=A0ABS3URB7_9ACTN|nr:hypothetical protein [Actinoplanes flavus]MBO3740283.1 hypothetical protein [Actinoplanes flavus]